MELNLLAVAASFPSKGQPLLAHKTVSDTIASATFLQFFKLKHKKSSYSGVRIRERGKGS